MKKNLFIIFAAALLLCGCAREQPPEETSPAPPPHEGVFVSDMGTLRFNGDGGSITLELGAELAEAAGLPEGQSEGSYAFLFHHGLWRYDQADTLVITVGEAEARFPNVFTETDEDSIVLLSPLPGGENLHFEKEAAK